MTRKFYIDREIEENYDVENKKGIVYNGIVQQLKKRDVAQLGSAFVLGTKCHRFKSCHPYLLLLSSLWAVAGAGRSTKVYIT
jgi:hypothetical protein